MISLTVEFGYHPYSLELQVGPITVEPLSGLKNTVAAVADSEQIDGDWIYAPLKRVRSFGGEIRERPYSARVFGLPKTHKITHAAADGDAHLSFHIWVLSFFEGIRLTATQAGFLDATPLRPGKLVDFNLHGNSRKKGIDLAEVFWSTHRDEPQLSQLFAAAVHALFLGQNPRHLQFEAFMLLYTAFDACYKLASSLYPSPKKVIHAKRVKWMCDLFAMATPDWADPEASSGPEVATLRNAMIHEALFFGEPLGFAIHGSNSTRNLTLEMQALVCRLLVALLGGSTSDYVRSPINTRQRHALKLS